MSRYTPSLILRFITNTSSVDDLIAEYEIDAPDLVLIEFVTQLFLHSNDQKIPTIAYRDEPIIHPIVTRYSQK